MRAISYKRHRFPPETIRLAVWLYFRFMSAAKVDVIGVRWGRVVKQLLIQECIAQRPIEQFNERILLQLAGIAVMPLDPVFAGPFQDRSAGELDSMAHWEAIAQRAAMP